MSYNKFLVTYKLRGGLIKCLTECDEALPKHRCRHDILSTQAITDGSKN